jgi:hypothetical protein
MLSTEGEGNYNYLRTVPNELLQSGEAYLVAGDEDVMLFLADRVMLETGGWATFSIFSSFFWISSFSLISFFSGFSLSVLVLFFVCLCCSLCFVSVFLFFSPVSVFRFSVVLWFSVCLPVRSVRLCYVLSAFAPLFSFASPFSSSPSVVAFLWLL